MVLSAPLLILLNVAIVNERHLIVSNYKIFENYDSESALEFRVKNVFHWKIYVSIMIQTHNSLSIEDK